MSKRNSDEVDRLIESNLSARQSKTVMLIDPSIDLLCLYVTALQASGWNVVGVATTSSEFHHLYCKMEMKPQLLIVEYNMMDQDTNNPSFDSIVTVLEYILQQHPNQQIIFVTSESRILSDLHFLSPSLEHIPVILKSTHTIEEMVLDLDELPFYYPVLTRSLG